MKNTNSVKSIEHLSLALVLSYFLFHKIYMVITGVILALYIINKEFINSLTLRDRGKETNKYKIDNQRKKDDKDRISNNDDNLISLVETIEESGYIPSIEKEDNRKVA